MKTSKHKNAMINKLSALVLFILITTVTMAQSNGNTNSVANQVLALQTAGEKFKEINIFSNAEIKTSADGEYTKMTLETGILNNVFDQNIDYIDLVIPQVNKVPLHIKLYKFELLTSDFEITTGDKNNFSKMESVDFRTKFKSYQGIINNDLNSIAAITFFKNKISGVISDGSGNYNLGSYENSATEYVFFNDKKLKLPLTFQCDYNDDNTSTGYTTEELNPARMQVLGCQKVFYDCDYDLYLSKGSNVTNVANYAVSLFTVVATLYDEVPLNMVLNEIHVWTTPDPFCATSSTCALTDFQLYYPFINGSNIGQLLALDNNGNGGLGNLGSLTCAAFSYAEITGSFNQLPTYSWDVMVSAHEMGHNLNCRHTHACVWNGNNTAIDGCGPASGYAYEGPCSGAPIPAGGGTIMSYCHLAPNPGINFSSGFGLQPSNVIYSYNISGLCFYSCSNSCLPYIFVTNLYANVNQTYTASNTIFSTQNSGLLNGVSIEFTANNLVRLLPGFFIPVGTNFIANNGNCSALNDDVYKKQLVANSWSENEINLQVVPNPFQSNFELSFNLKQDEKTSIVIYNMVGVKVKEISARKLYKGFNKIVIDCNDITTGVYIIEINIAGVKTVKRIVKN